jgi:hypothetical protein
MAKKKKPRIDDSIVLFDVVYEDGTRSSRRRVSAAEISEHDSDDHAKTVIMAQDRKISDVSGRDRGSIRSIARSAT